MNAPEYVKAHQEWKSQRPEEPTLILTRPWHFRIFYDRDSAEYRVEIHYGNSWSTSDRSLKDLQNHSASKDTFIFYLRGTLGVETLLPMSDEDFAKLQEWLKG